MCVRGLDALELDTMRSFIPRASPLCFLMFGLLTLLHQFKSHHAFVRPIVSSTKFISFTTSSVSNIHKASSLKEAISASLTSSDAISSSDSVGSNENNITIRRMTLKDVATVFHIGESVFTSSKFPQLYRTWSAYEVSELTYISIISYHEVDIFLSLK